MNERKKRTFIACLSSLVLALAIVLALVPSSTVDADGGDTGEGGSGGQGIGCNENVGACWYTSSGARITITDANGDRCKFKKTGDSFEICTDDPTGTELKSIDVWFSRVGGGKARLDKLVGFGNDCTYYRSNDGKRHTKQEFIAGKDGGYWSTGCYDFVYGADTYVIGDILPGYSYSGWSGLSSGSGTIYDNPQNGPLFWETINCYVNPKSANDPTNPYRNSRVTCSNTAVDYTPIVKILNYSGAQGVNAENMVFSSYINNSTGQAETNMFVQLDQIVATGVYKTWGGFNESHIGLVAEVYSWCKNHDSENTGTAGIRNSGAAFTCGFMDKTGYTAGWYNTRSFANLSAISGLWARDASGNNSTAYQTSVLIERANYFTSANTANVMRLWLDLDPCGSELKQIFKENKGAQAYSDLREKYMGKTKTDFLINYPNYVDAKFWYDNNETLKKTLTCSSSLKCHEKAQAIYRKCSASPGNRCTVGTRNFGGYEEALVENSAQDPEWSIDGRTKTPHNKEITDYSKNQWHLTYMKYQRKLTAGYFPTSCAPAPCEQNNIDKMFAKVFKRSEKYNEGGYSYDEYFDWLLAATGAKYLSKELWVQVGLESPQCDVQEPDCPAGGFDNTCGTPIVLSDYQFGLNNSEAQKCWMNGWAYTNGGVVGSFVKKIGYGDAEHICKLYCSEQVTFNLPNAGGSDGGANSPIRAGTIFKWGTDPNTKGNEYGKMTIVKKCSVKNDKILNSEGDRVDSDCSNLNVLYRASDWAPNTRTTFNLDYMDPTGTYKYQGMDYITIRNDRFPDESQDINATCTNKSCSNLSPDMLTTSASWYILYQKSLNWYGNKTTGEPVPEKDGPNIIDSTEAAWYKWIGYGLPTSFMTPDGNYGVSASSDGRLAMIIGNLGSYSNAQDHFASLLKYLTGQTEITYSCSFNMINELFGKDCEYDPDGKLLDISPEYCDPTKDDKIDDPGTGIDTNRYIRDIDVVFRVIDLISDNNVAPNGSIVGNAFPGILGEGRIRGRNWAKLSDSEVEDILREDIYQKEPMYSLELNTANIQYIRKLNREARENNIDPYSEMRMFTGIDSDTTPDNKLAGYTGYYCVSYDANPTFGKDTYKYCASRFISYLSSDAFKNHGGARLEGTCVEANSIASKRAITYSKLLTNGKLVGCPKN